MFNTSARLERRDEPYRYYTAGGLISPDDLRRLNSEIPDRDLFKREIKVGAEHRKQYNMWRFGVYEDGAKAARTDELPKPWSELIDSVLSPEFADWMRRELDFDVTEHDLTLGLYIFGDRDYTTVDTGKLRKAISFGLYLNEEWDVSDGGHFRAWESKDAPEPAGHIVPFGGHCAILRPAEDTWHNIDLVDTGGSRERLTMMIEYWKR